MTNNKMYEAIIDIKECIGNNPYFINELFDEYARLGMETFARDTQVTFAKKPIAKKVAFITLLAMGTLREDFGGWHVLNTCQPPVIVCAIGGMYRSAYKRKGQYILNTGLGVRKREKNQNGSG